MNRTEIIQALIDAKKARRYLEIGVAHGDNFFRLKRCRKTAVDIKFIFSPLYRFAWSTVNPYNIPARFLNMTSDDFFASKKCSSGFDIVFIDGLHTYKQSLRDVVNALAVLNRNGVIVLHDCNPPRADMAAAAHSFDQFVNMDRTEAASEWCGDVWKTICCLRSTRRDLNVFVLDCDCGVGIISRGNPDQLLPYTEQELENMKYEDLAADRKKLLNLKNENYLADYLSSGS